MIRALHIILILVLLSIGSVNGQTIKKQRIKDIVNTNYWNTSENLVDSLHYVYSGKRGSRFIPSDFYNGNVYGYDSHYYPDQYDLADLPEPLHDLYRLSVHYDTCWQHYTTHTPNGRTQVLAERKVADRNAEGQIVRFRDGYTMTTGYSWGKNVYYDDKGHIAKVHHLQYDTLYNVVDTISERLTEFNAEGQLIWDSVSVSSSLYLHASHYSYDATGRVTSIFRRVHGGIWIHETNRLLSYNEKGLLTSQVTLMKDSGREDWDTSYVLLFGYDHNDRLFSYRSLQGGSIPIHYYEMHYNGQGLVDTLIRANIPLGEQRQLTQFFYNSYQNPDSAYTYQYGADGTRDSVWNKTLYYYEEYDDSVVVPPPANDRKIVIYPNPSNGEITIQWNKKLPAGAVHLNLYNSAGQLVGQLFLADVRAENKLKLQGLSSGAYFLRITTPGGGILHTETLSISNNGG